MIPRQSLYVAFGVSPDYQLNLPVKELTSVESSSLIDLNYSYSLRVLALDVGHSELDVACPTQAGDISHPNPMPTIINN